VNLADQPVLIVDGETLDGAKQNRVVNLTILVPAHGRPVIPVSCAEAARWCARSRAFTSSPHTQFASGRARRMARASHSTVHRGEFSLRSGRSLERHCREVGTCARDVGTIARRRRFPRRTPRRRPASSSVSSAGESVRRPLRHRRTAGRNRPFRPAEHAAVNAEAGSRNCGGCVGHCVSGAHTLSSVY
jgi:hypothetical protein